MVEHNTSCRNSENHRRWKRGRRRSSSSTAWLLLPLQKVMRPTPIVALVLAGCFAVFLHLGSKSYSVGLAYYVYYDSSSSRAASATTTTTRATTQMIPSVATPLLPLAVVTTTPLLPTLAQRGGDAALAISPQATLAVVVATATKTKPGGGGGGALCIKNFRWYGRTFNRIHELANALSLVAVAKTSQRGAVDGSAVTFVALEPRLSDWYSSFLDPRDDIVLNYTGPCVSEWLPKDLFYHKPLGHARQELQQLIPKAVFRAEAEAALAELSTRGSRQQQQQPVTTVHRRHLEGKCEKKAKSRGVACLNPQARKQLNSAELVDSCRIDFGMIAAATEGSVVVLCTDNQVPELDQTFPHISNHSFPVQAWMMARSDIHYGNPMSTVDMVVAAWRQGRETRPNACYGGGIEADSHVETETNSGLKLLFQTSRSEHQVGMQGRKVIRRKKK